MPAAAGALIVFTVLTLTVRAASHALSFDWRTAVPLISVLAAAVGVMAGNYFRGNPFPWEPDGKWWHWAWWAIGVAFATEAIARIPGVPLNVGYLFRGTAAGVIAAFVTPPEWQKEALWWVPLMAVSLAAVWAVVDAVGRCGPGGSTTAALAVVAGGASVVLIHNTSPGFTDISVCLFTALMTLAVAAWVTGTDCGAAGAVAVVPIILLLAMGRALVDSKIPASSFYLVAAAPLTLSFFLLPSAKDFCTRPTATPTKILFVLVPVLIAAYRATNAAPLVFATEAEKW
ncbi:hypothetical protein [Fimbriiglobus ruber]|uniref:Uncharacterized protein n=1 Tax=Fimbriiglobus ruber TaxID=1908690 RepID=A0A225DGB2_9BACT|nr:hypothetical protein [Fimbriiglobus ruber]OWK40512.1 hypothetical protein FRUB_05431 [Fimbriiglobus ruber]